ncbi:MAG: hypothetical protein HY660_14185, partial [Armatimonadetes bacterium]|nr:hypothetical protein [Armatimonadota bacterium]
MTRIRIVMAMLVCALGVAPAVGQTTPQAVWQSTLTIGVASEGETFDPHLNVTSVGNQRIWSIYEGLLRYAPDGKIVGNLAESWKV